MVWRGETTEARLSGAIAWSVLEVREGRPVYRAGIEFDEPVPLFLEHELNRSPETIPAPDSRTLLIVEDDGPLRNLLVRVLAQRGYTVLQAANGAEALDLLSSHPAIDLIIADVEMPVMDGLGLIGRLQRRPGVSKLLLMSGCADLSATRIYGRTWPFLTKPFTAPVLLQSVQHVLKAN
jgi:two-component system cell cycle sensor histidine kinase/response regulator CckA